MMSGGPVPGGMPLAQDEGVVAVLRAALSRRTRLIPYYYTLCFAAFSRCEPILRPVFFDDPADPTLRSIDTMFLAGPNVLVVPRLSADTPKPSPPLKGAWRKIDWGDGEQPDLPDVYLRPGAILPLGPVMQHTGEKPLDPLTLVVNLDEQGQAWGELYEDEGDGYSFYRNQCRRIVYKATTESGSVFIRLAALDGGLPIPRRKVEVRILTGGGEVTGTGSERGTIKIDLEGPAGQPDHPPALSPKEGPP
jgi:alpha-glucosidase